MQRLTLATLAAITGSLTAQNPCHGNGVGNAFVENSPAIVGGTLTMRTGSPTAPNGIGLLLFGNGAGVAFPECLDISGLFLSVIAVLDNTGEAQFSFPIGSGLFGAAPLFTKSLVLDSAGWSLSRTSRVSIEHPNSTRELAPLPAPRTLHSLTALARTPRDNRNGAFQAGGGTGSFILPVAAATTAVFDELARTWSPGPLMAVPRVRHAAVLLQDGRVLITGGMVNAGAPATGGPGTAHCEIYDPSSNTFSPTGAMPWPRFGHAMTLLNDGRVLVTGGFADWTNAGTSFAARLNTAADTTAVWDPLTDTWKSLPAMASPRAGHSQTLLADGRVLVAGGVSGGHQMSQSGFVYEVPHFTSSAAVFDPVSELFTPTPPMLQAVGFHGASRLPNGTVLVTGGASALGFGGEAVATTVCQRYSTTTNSWQTGGSLSTGVAFHTHETIRTSGEAWLAGGYVGSFVNLIGSSGVVRHDGITVANLGPLGSNPGVGAPLLEVGAAASALLHDGTLLHTGGYGNFTTANPTSDRCLIVIAP
jgi:hypothetical protein